MKANEQQIGGGHYKDMAIQPIEFITKNNIPFIEGNIIKYICRWRAKGGVEDLKKARHYLDMLIDEDQPPDNPEQFEVGDRVLCDGKEGIISTIDTGHHAITTYRVVFDYGWFKKEYLKKL